MSRLARWSSIALAASFALAIPGTAHAQFGGLKKKVKDKIAGDPQPAAAPAGNAADADAQARKEAWDHPAPIGGSTLDAFAKGMKGEQAQRAQYAAQKSTAVARWNAYKAEQAQCDADKAHADTTLIQIQQKMIAEARAGNAPAVQAMQDSMQKLVASSGAIGQRCNAIRKPEFTPDDFAAVHAEEDKEDAAGAAASGMSSVAYARLKERVIAYVLLPPGWKANGYSAEETQAMDARRAELRKLSSDYNANGMRNPLGT